MGTRTEGDIDEFMRVDEHPWDEWFDGGLWRLEQGEDFGGDVKAFKAQVYRAARKRGLKVRAQMDGDAVLVQSKGAREEGGGDG